jgi:putative heme-binding domain-containing protein
MPLELFLAATTHSNARVRLQAAIGLGRMGRVAGVPALLPLTMDPDDMVAHSAIHGLVILRAAQYCLHALEAPELARLIPGATQVLQALHDVEVADGLIARLALIRESFHHQAILKALCRLYHREADWDGKWWGTRPDTSGPYFKPVPWEASERIGEALRAELLQASGEARQWLALEMLKNKVDLPEVTPVVLALASNSPSFRASAVEALASRSNPARDVTAFLENIARLHTEDPALRVKAIRALQRRANRGALSPAVVQAVLDITGMPQPSRELQNVWEEFVRDGRNGRRVEEFARMAQARTPAERLLGYSVLLSLANQRQGSRQGRGTAIRLIEGAWTQPDSTVCLLEAIARSRTEQYSHQVRAHLNDSRTEVRLAAQHAARELGLDKPNRATGAALIESLPYEEMVAQATREKGDARRRARLFVSQGCNACHTVTPEEPAKGPFLGGIATRYSRVELCESILKPSATIAQGFETQYFTMEEGEEVEGFVVREGGDEIEIRNIQGITTTLLKKSIKNRGTRETSMMPAGLVDTISPSDLAALLGYWESLKSKP